MYRYTAARTATSAELAREAHSKLQYDFPMVTAQELDALALELHASPC